MKRQSNIELLRIVLMLMIITHHVLVHGLGLKRIPWRGFHPDDLTYIELAINSFVVIAVNTFIFISGYFGMRFKLRTILSFVAQAVFYSVVLYLLFCWINPKQWNPTNFLKSFFPISNNVWWFISTYVGLYFLAPFLNAGMEQLDRKKSQTLLIGLLVLNCFSGFLFGTLSSNGYSLFNFIVIYVMARYMATYSIKTKRPFRWLSASTLLLFSICAGLLMFDKRHELWIAFSYNNPIILFSGAMLFFTFQNLQVNYNRLINTLAGTSLGIYMIHDYGQIRIWLSGIISQIKNGNTLFAVPLIILIICGIYTASASIDFVRKMLFNQISNLFENKIR